EQVHFLIGLPTTSFKDRFRFEAWIINALLGGGMTSRLFQSVRERKGLVYSVHSSLNSYEDCGQMLIYAATDAEKVQELTEVVTHELKKLKRKGVTRGDVDLFKTQVKGALLLGSDDVENRMHSLAVNEIVFGHYRSVESVIEEIDQITADSVNQFLDTRFNTKQVSGVLLGEGVSRLESWWKEVEF
ncbi:MAG: insulinase family protein, partial [Bdellovibrionaceae bacterium]|nr:insulinase family protein [Pseudobdellovibrionaceae bacterium]